MTVVSPAVDHTAYRLVRPDRPAPMPPALDAAQQRVVDHAAGPLLVLAGPGTGKTTTLVEAVAARARAGVPVEQMLMLTFSRRAAHEMRDRVAARLGRTVREPIARTLHSYAFGILRMAAVLRGEPTPRLLTASEQDVVIRELLADGDPARWPADLRPALRTLRLRRGAALAAHPGGRARPGRPRPAAAGPRARADRPGSQRGSSWPSTTASRCCRIPAASTPAS